MELWIRSQDKTRLVKVCSLEYGEYNEIYYINGYCVNEIDNYDLGTYKTKERALEVLDEIQRKITQNECLKIMIPKLNNVKGEEENIGKLFKEMVYEMPKE